MRLLGSNYIVSNLGSQIAPKCQAKSVSNRPIQLLYKQNYYTNLNQIVHNDRDHQVYLSDKRPSAATFKIEKIAIS